MSILGLSLCQWGLPPDRAQEPGDAPEGLQLPLPWAEACGDRGWGGLHQEGMEDTPELAKNLRPSRLPPEQGGPEGCQRQPVWHVHHPLSQGEAVRVCQSEAVTLLLSNHYSASCSWLAWRNLFTDDKWPGSWSLNILTVSGSQLFWGHFYGRQGGNPRHTQYQGDDIRRHIQRSAKK